MVIVSLKNALLYCFVGQIAPTAVESPLVYKTRQVTMVTSYRLQVDVEGTKAVKLITLVFMSCTCDIPVQPTTSRIGNHTG